MVRIQLGSTPYLSLLPPAVGTYHDISHFLDFSSLPFCFLPDLFLTTIAQECYHLTALLAMGAFEEIWPWEYPHHP